MARFKKLPQKQSEGEIVYGNGIVDKIVEIALKELDDVELYSGSNNLNTKKAIKVFFDNNGVNIQVSVKIHYMQSVSDVAFKVQEVIRHNVESMTEYHIASVNVFVSGVSFEDRTSEEKNIKENKDNK